MIAPLPPGRFRLIFADAPWRFVSHDGLKSVPTLGADPYPTMSQEELEALPVASLAHEDGAVLLMWTTSDQVANCLKLAEGWGFTFKSLGPIWAKERSPNQTELFEHAPICDLGMGYWFRQQAEIVLLFTIGQPERVNAGVRQMIYEPRREHSRKPDLAYTRAMQLVAGPYLELFARTQRPGWTVWGNEVEKFGGA